MVNRLLLLLFGGFWLLMNGLLWRSEFGERKLSGGSVPVDLVWQKILTAPDNSSLEIRHQGRKTGYCRWSPNMGQEMAAAVVATEDVTKAASGQTQTNYQIDFEGNVALADIPNRLHFDFGMHLATNQAWQELHLRLSLRPSVLELHADAAEKVLRLHTQGGEDDGDKVFRFEDLRNPRVFLTRFELPPPLGFLAAMGSVGGESSAAPSLGLNWEARNDWISIGHTSVRAYRLQARMLDRYEIVVLVSRVGELLRVELPDKWTLVNDQLTLQ